MAQSCNEYGSSITDFAAEFESKLEIKEEVKPANVEPVTSAPPPGPITEEELRAFFAQRSSVTLQDLMVEFAPRIETREERDAFKILLTTISRIEKTDGAKYVVLKEVKPVISGPVTEQEIRAVFAQRSCVPTHYLAAEFASRLETKEERDAFVAILRRISRMQKTDGTNYVVLKDVKPVISGPITEEEIRAVLVQMSSLTTLDLVFKFKSRLRTKEGRDAFAEILRRIARIQKTDGASYVVLKEVKPVISGPVTEEEIRAVLVRRSFVTTRDLAAEFPSRLQTREERDAFATIVRSISRTRKTHGAKKYLVLKAERNDVEDQPAAKRRLSSGVVKRVKPVNVERVDSAAAPPSGPVTEEEIRAVLVQTTQDLVAEFESKLEIKEEKVACATILTD